MLKASKVAKIIPAKNIPQEGSSLSFALFKMCDFLITMGMVEK